MREGLADLKKESLVRLCRAQLLPISGNKRLLVDRIMRHWNTAEIQVSFNDVEGSAEATIRAWYKPQPVDGDG